MNSGPENGTGNCFPEAVLDEFALNRLEGPLCQAVARHIEGCAKCRALSQKLRDDSARVREMLAAAALNPGSECFDDESLAWYLDGNLEEDSRNRLEDHLCVCRGCQARLAAIYREVKELTRPDTPDAAREEQAEYTPDGSATHSTTPAASIHELSVDGSIRHVWAAACLAVVSLCAAGGAAAASLSQKHASVMLFVALGLFGVAMALLPSIRLRKIRANKFVRPISSSIAIGALVLNGIMGGQIVWLYIAGTAYLVWFSIQINHGFDIRKGRNTGAGLIDAKAEPVFQGKRKHGSVN